MEFAELEKIYRQHDEGFINLLNGIRNRSITDGGLALLNQRYMPEFEPSLSDFYVHLTTTNLLAKQVNSRNGFFKEHSTTLVALPGVNAGSLSDGWLVV